MDENILIIGLDGGATKISAWEVRYNSDDGTFLLGDLNATKTYSDIPGFLTDFKPVDIAVQLSERDQEKIPQTISEKQQETVYVEACALVIEEIVAKKPDRPVLIGLGMPGLKTESKRGIAVVLNGPRMTNYANLLEKRLSAAGISLAGPLKHLGSDADYCGIGENYSTDGLFKDARNAYYLGGGTGAADAIKLDGELCPFDKIKEWMAKSWEMKASTGLSMERYASAGGIQSVYSTSSDIPIEELNAQQVYPLQIAERAQQGEAAAQKALTEVSEYLGLLFFERTLTLYSGWSGLFEFMNPQRPALSAEHSFRNSSLEHIIIGQRLGQLFESSAGQKFVAKPTIEKFKDLVKKESTFPENIKNIYLDTTQLFQISKLREAPAMGAGIDAFLSR